VAALGGLIRRFFAPPPLRPPGARPEAQLAALCIRCGRCVAACPYRALDAKLTDPRAVRMGLARVERDLCFTFQGILCRTCLDECPFEGEAILQDDALRPVVTERCVGCGICEARCPAPEVAIRILPAGRRP
jgi:ferredoxin-type protein NapG